MSQNKPTVDEHYVPRCYLKQFTKDEEHIYQYDVLSERCYPNPVPINSICYKKNLYEFRDEDGAFIGRNLIEKSFMMYEGAFATVFRSINAKTNDVRNMRTLSFLTEKEKAFLTVFVATMIIREPGLIQSLTETTSDIFKNQISDRMAKNLVLQTGLPIYKEINVEESNLFNAVLGFFEDMSFQIGKTDSDIIWTSDTPVFLYGDSNSVRVHAVLVPLSPCLVLTMKPYAQTERELYNRFLVLNDIKSVNRIIVSHCKRWIYSKEQFTDKQILWIKKSKELKTEILQSQQC